MIRFSVPKDIKEGIKPKDILLAYSKRGQYSLWDIGKMDKVKNFTIERDLKVGLEYFYILTDSLLYETDSGVVYNYIDEKVVAKRIHILKYLIMKY